MRITFILLFLWSGLHFVGNAQVVAVESFNNTTFPPVGWAIKPAMTQNVWVRQTNGTFPTVVPYSGAGLARFRSRSVVAGTKQTLISRPIDYSNRGSSAANLNFWMYRDDENTNSDSLTVWASNVDSLDASAVYLGTITRCRTIAMPNTEATNGWYNYSFSIPATFTNSTTTRFIFEGTSESPNAGQGANIFIDELSFDEFPNPCTGTPNVGILNAQPTIICGGSGTSNLSLSTPITGVTGLTYVWQEGLSATGPWTTFGNNSTIATTNTLTATTYFQCMVTCSFSGLTYTTPVDSVVVSNNPVPTITATPPTATFCPGSAGASISASGGMTYTWSPATGLNTTSGAAVLASPANNTVYTVVGIDSSGCSGSATVTVNTGTLPNVAISASPSDSICAGGTIILNSIPGGPSQGNTYLWSDGKTTRRDTIVVTANATYWVTVTNQAGCSASDTISVYALPGQNSGFTYTSVGNTYTFVDTTLGGSAWIWNFGDGNGSNSPSPVYTYSAPGTYTVTLIVTGNCTTDTVTQVVYVYPAGVTAWAEQMGLTMYPNPVNDYLMLEAKDEIRELVIYDAMGKRVVDVKLNQPSLTIEMNTSSLANGFYSVKVLGKKGIGHATFIKQ